MEIKQYIFDLLFTQECVILPSLGTFKTITVSSFIDDKNKTISPPRKRVVFEESTSISSDNFLAQSVSESEGIGIELANLEVEVFISDIQSRILGGETVKLEGIGSLSIGTKGKILFVEEADTNFHPDSYGLSTIRFVNSETVTNQPTIVTPPTKKRSWKWFVWLIVLLVIGGLGYFAYKAGYVGYVKNYIQKFHKDTEVDTVGSNDKTTELEEDLAKSLKEENVVKIDTSKSNTNQLTEVLTKEEKKEEKKEELKQPTNQVDAEAKFFIIESSYGDSINAVKRSIELKKMGYNSQLMPKENNSFRVTMGAFTNRSTAVIELDRIKSETPKLKVWIYTK